MRYFYWQKKFLMNPIYKNQIVRDLYWVISSPALFEILPNSNSLRILNQQLFDTEIKSLSKTLIDLDNNPEPLIEHIQFGNNKLLGKYYESLVEYWFQISRRFEIVDKSVQLNHNGETLGEFDFILKDKIRDKFIHLESAGKFYLSSENKSDWKTFIGPNPNDNLQNKMEKLFNEQTQLSKTSLGKEKLTEMGVSEVESAMLLKGYIFYQIKNFLSNQLIIPVHSNPNHNKGWWLRFGEVENLYNLNCNQWLVLKRHNWISRAVASTENELLNTSDLFMFLKSYFEFNHYPILIASMEKYDNHFTEITRGFVVSDLWPDLNFIH